MTYYIINRVLFFIPVLLIISLSVFFLNKIQPTDPVEKICDVDDQTGCDSINEARVVQRLNLDKPVFYFSITTQSYPKDLYKIPNRDQRENVKRLINISGDGEAVMKYFELIQHVNWKIYHAKTKGEIKPIARKMRTYFNQMLTDYKREDVEYTLNRCKAAFGNRTDLSLYALLIDIENQYNSFYTPNTAKKYLPVFYWYGVNNQYQLWMQKLFRLDFGQAYDGTFVIEKIKENIPWTIFMSSLAIIFAYVIAIPLGVVSAIRKDSRLDRNISGILFALYSLPNFWVAMLLITFFANPDFFYWFPTSGYSSIIVREGDEFADTLHHMILPLFCWTYPALAFLSRQMRMGMIKVLKEDYIRTARAKGLPENKIIWKHCFKNAIVPIITMLGGVLPRLVAGSVVLEYIFSLPGMGSLLFDSINDSDFPTIFAIVMLVSVLTVIGYLISDILYKIVDPRVKF